MCTWDDICDVIRDQKDRRWIKVTITDKLFVCALAFEIIFVFIVFCRYRSRREDQKDRRWVKATIIENSIGFLRQAASRLKSR